MLLSRLATNGGRGAAQRRRGQPEQNGVRRPRPDGECGKAWALFDQLSQNKGAPVAAADPCRTGKGTGLDGATSVRDTRAGIPWPFWDGPARRTARRSGSGTRSLKLLPGRQPLTATCPGIRLRGYLPERAMNQQPIGDRSGHPWRLLDVHSIFYTVQGEGPFSGFPAVFIRLAGCNLQCPWCDTEYTQGRRLAHPQVVAQYVHSLSLPKGLVVITRRLGPFRQNLTSLLTHLDKLGHLVQIETNGTLAPSEFHYSKYPRMDHYHGVYIVCSQDWDRVNPGIVRHACCFKYVLGCRFTWIGWVELPTFALGHTANPRLARPPTDWEDPIYLQPMDTKDPAHNMRNIQAVTQSCMKHGYRLQLQIHKYIGVE